MRASRSETGRRSEPVQSRASATVTKLLDAAAALIGVHGIDGVTTNHIAAEADVAVGTLYRYFSDKDAVLAALAARHVQGLSAMFDSLVADDPMLDLPDLLDRVIDPIVGYAARHPDVGEVLRYSAGRDLPAVHAMYRFLVDLVAGVVEAWVPGVPPDERDTTAATVVSLARGMLFEAPVRTAAERHRLVVELKYVLQAYVIAKYPGPDAPVWLDPDPRPAPRRPARR